jgi:hypothetical protein
LKELLQDSHGLLQTNLSGATGTAYTEAATDSAEAYTAEASTHAGDATQVVSVCSGRETAAQAGDAATTN